MRVRIEESNLRWNKSDAPLRVSEVLDPRSEENKKALLDRLAAHCQ